MVIELPRRRFIAGITAVICAPAIVRAASLMPVKAYSQGLTEAEMRRIMLRIFEAKTEIIRKGMEDAILYGTVPYRLVPPAFYGKPLPFHTFQSSFQQPMVLR